MKKMLKVAAAAPWTCSNDALTDEESLAVLRFSSIEAKMRPDPGNPFTKAKQQMQWRSRPDLIWVCDCSFAC